MRAPGRRREGGPSRSAWPRAARSASVRGEGEGACPDPRAVHYCIYNVIRRGQPVFLYYSHHFYRVTLIQMEFFGLLV